MAVAALLCAAVLVAGAAGLREAELAFAANVSGAARTADFAFRITNAATWDVPLVSSGGAFSSRSVAVHASEGSQGGHAGATLDSVWAVALVLPSLPPLGWLAYYGVDVDLSATAYSAWLSLDVSAASGFIASTFVSLVERSPQGVVVQQQSLAQDSNIFHSNRMQYSRTAAGQKDGLSWMTLTGSTGNSWNISFTWIVSNRVGVLSYGNTIVAPKMLECVIEINNWPYLSSANKLSLLAAAATGNLTVGGTAIVSNSGERSSVFFALSRTAVIDAAPTSVSVSRFTDAEWSATFSTPLVSAQLSKAFRSGFSVKVAEVTFPAGARSIVYDPGMGSGQNPYAEGPSVGLIVGMVFLALFVAAAAVVVAVLLLRRHKKKKQVAGSLGRGLL